MFELLPPFNFTNVFITPWRMDAASYVWIFLMGFFVTTSCGLIGQFLLLRRMALVGDAISHSVLPGLAVAFLLSGSRGSLAMFVGAVVAALLTTMIIEFIHSKTRIKQDSAISIAFTTLFALGVVLITLFADSVDLDQDCVLYGEIAFVSLEEAVLIGGQSVGPASVLRMACVLLGTIVLLLFFYKELLFSSFDGGMAKAVGLPVRWMHYGLMAWLSIVVVSAFESVGAILVVAMLILPGASASMLSRKLPTILMLTVVHALLSSLLGLHLAIWLDSSIAAAMVLVGAILFVVVWAMSPTQGLVAYYQRRKRVIVEP